MSAAIAVERPVFDIRRIPLPCIDPPYDAPSDPAYEPQEPMTLVIHHEQTVLDLTFPLPSGVPAVPEPPKPPNLRLVRTSIETDQDLEPGESEIPLDPTVDPLPWRREPAELPDAGSWAPRLVQGLIEVLNGLRPAPQLVRWTSAEVYTAVRHQLRRTSALGTRPSRLLVRSVRSFEPEEGIAEVTAVIQIGPRVRALALRIEALANRWQCTALHLI
jgi:hypothetical protein